MRGVQDLKYLRQIISSQVARLPLLKNLLAEWLTASEFKYAHRYDVLRYQPHIPAFMGIPLRTYQISSDKGVIQNRVRTTSHFRAGHKPLSQIKILC